MVFFFLLRRRDYKDDEEKQHCLLAMKEQTSSDDLSAKIAETEAVSVAAVQLMARFRGAQVRLSELARLKGEAEECEQEMLRLTKEVEEKKKAEEEAGDKLNEVKERQSTVAELQEGAKDAERIHREAQALAEITRDLRGKLPAGRSADAVRSLADTRDDLKHKQEQRDELREQIEEGQAKLGKIVAKDQRLQSELVSKQGQLLAAEKGAQDMRDLTQQVEGLDKQLHEATDALAQADEEKKPLQSAVASKEKELKAALKTGEHEEKRTRQRQERMASELKSLSSYHKQVEAYVEESSYLSTIQCVARNMRVRTEK